MTKRTTLTQIISLGAALWMPTAHAAGLLTPGYIWIGAAGDAGNGAASAGPTSPQGSVPTQVFSGVTPPFSMAQTIAAALQSSADIKIAQRNVEIDRKKSDEADAAGRPSVAANGTFERFDQPTLVRIGSGPALQVTPTHQEILQLNISNRFDLSGQIHAASSQARLQSLADEFILGEFRNARILRAQTIYFNTLRAEHQVQVASAALRNAQQQESDAAKLYVGQIGAKIDLLRAQTQVANANQSVTASVNSLAIAQTSYNNLAGRPLDAPVAVLDVPGVTVGDDVSDSSSVGTAAAPAQAPYSVPADESAAINITQALKTAETRRPEILAAQVNIRVAETGIKLARAGLDPSLSLSAAGNYYPTPSFQFPRQRTAQITATLSIPLYDGGATRGRVDEARLRTENARTSLASTETDVALDVRQSYLNQATAARQIDAANAALKSAVAARQLAQIRYQGQVGLYLEVTDAQSALVQAENAQVDAVYNYLVSRAQFENAVGTPQSP